LINCGAGGDCNGGDALSVFKFAKTNGIPEESCQNYVAANPAHETCSPIQVCETCIPPPPPAGKTLPQNCAAITKYPNWKVSAYGPVIGAANIKKAIYGGGPVACAMDVTEKFEAYTGGIFSEKVLIPISNHIVSLVGWGVDPTTKEEYWIGRNSWGSYWGELGFFRIKMYKENLGIENSCSYGIPIVDN